LEAALLRRFIYANHERQLNRTYRNRLANRGNTAQGVFWRSQTSQIARFDALLSLVHQIAPQKPVTIADIGCGYGAMLAFINKTPAYAQTIYHGVDINRAMIAACHQTFPAENALFTIGNTPPKLVDFCVFSGTFNLTHSDDPDLWMDYIFACLDRCMARARYGLVLNLLCAPKAKIESQIFLCRSCSLYPPCRSHDWPNPRAINKICFGDVSFVITRKT
jgi:SAM-dependent methyltransferase